MDALALSRWQFAATTIFHFLFVPLTLGLSILIALMETQYVRTKDETYRTMAKFWGKLFLVNFAVGIVTGITLEFQFGTNWSRYAAYVGDIFGALLAIEATAAFFIESTFIAVWAFGWERLSPKMHAAAIWIVAAASNLSAVWILIANAWMQHPVGYTVRNGRAELADFGAVVTQPFALQEIAHTLAGAYILSAFVVLGVSAWHMLKGQHGELFVKSFRIAAAFALLFSTVEIVQGHIHGAEVARIQPAKLAAMESLWETQPRAPLTMLLVPDEKNERNSVELIKVPGALSMLAYHSPDETVKGLRDFPRGERPPVLVSFLAFRLMVALGMLFLLLSAAAFLLRNNIDKYRLLLWALVLAVPLPYVACQAGWVLAEVGRQPWIVYGLMKTADAVSPVAPSMVAFSLAALVLLYGVIGVAGGWLMVRHALAGPAKTHGKEV